MNLQTALLDPDARGGQPLWRVFWIEGVLLSQLLFGLILFLRTRVGSAAFGLLLTGFVLYTAWIMRLVWINAPNTRNENYTYIARALTVAWALNAVLVSLFLFLGHLGHIDLPF